MQLRELLAAQRHHLADQLTGLSPNEWETETLCEGWTVRHVVAHVTMPFRYGTVSFVLGMVRARGDFNRFADRVAQRDATLPTAELVRQLRDNADHPYRPPGAGYEAPLTDLVVHSLDIARPLSISSEIDPAAFGVVLEHLVTPSGLKFFGLDLDGLCLRAVDVGWSHGAGEVVSGTAEDLVMALTRRKTEVDLTGDGVSRLLAGAR